MNAELNHSLLDAPSLPFSVRCQGFAINCGALRKLVLQGGYETITIDNQLPAPARCVYRLFQRAGEV
jgi:hypothetical protein